MECAHTQWARGDAVAVRASASRARPVPCVTTSVAARIMLQGGCASALWRWSGGESCAARARLTSPLPKGGILSSRSSSEGGPDGASLGGADMAWPVRGGDDDMSFARRVRFVVCSAGGLWSAGTLSENHGV